MGFPCIKKRSKKLVKPVFKLKALIKYDNNRIWKKKVNDIIHQFLNAQLMNILNGKYSHLHLYEFFN